MCHHPDIIPNRGSTASQVIGDGLVMQLDTKNPALKLISEAA